MSRFLLLLLQALAIVFTAASIYRISQNQATKAWSAGQFAGYQGAEHDIALHWYRKCLDDGPYEDERVDWHRYCDQIFESELGFKNRWRGEMP